MWLRRSPFVVPGIRKTFRISQALCRLKFRTITKITRTPRRNASISFSKRQRDSFTAGFCISQAAVSPRVPQTLTEKIVQLHSLDLAKDQQVKAGDYIALKPHYCMTHDNSWPTALKFRDTIGASKIRYPGQIVMTLDHEIQDIEKNRVKYANIEKFAREQGVDFYPAGRGIGHQIMVEEGYAFPGKMVVASDSHSNMYGGVGCLGTPVVRTDAAAIWATGQTWWRIPQIAKVQFVGTLPEGVTGKDVIIALTGLFNNDEVLNYAIEFTGSPETMKSLSVDTRLTIANMATEWGALTGLFPIDSTLEKWLRNKATAAAKSEDQNRTTAKRLFHERLDDLFANSIFADKDARYAKYLYLDLSTLSPYVSGPNSVKVATPLRELSAQNIKIDKAYLVSCTNSRASDLAAAAQVFRDAAKRGIASVKEGVKLYVAAASLPEQRIAESSGDWKILLDAGAIPLPSGCGPCIGLGAGILGDGEVGISASNRNFKGRMGKTSAFAYLASPEVVAASALYGKITGPGNYKQPRNWSGIIMGEGKITEDGDQITLTAEKEFEPNETAEEDTEIDILPGFQENIEGEIVFLDADNISTDAIYPGKYTYEDNISEEQRGQYCMENYDSSFGSIARPGDLIVTGFNFGCGSSREQAATSILAKGIPLVISGSVGNTFSRNAINNALPLLEIPHLVQRLRETFPFSQSEKAKLLTRRTGWILTWDVRTSKVVVKEGGGKTWSRRVPAFPRNLQEIIACKGLEGWVRRSVGSEKN